MTNDRDASPAPPLPGSMASPTKIGRIALLLVFLSLLVSGLYWWQLVNSAKQLRSETVAQAELRGQQLNRAVSNEIALLIRYIDIAAQELASSYQPGKPEEFDSRARQVERRFPEKSLLQIAVIDAQGYLAYSNLGFREALFLGDREHFKAHLTAKTAQLHISQPVLGRVSKQWTIQFSRPIQHNGRFAGVIVFSLSPDYLHKTLLSIPLAADDAIAIYRQDGAYLARNRENESALGKNVGTNRAFVGPNAAASGSFRAAANFDKVVRLFQWQRLNDSPVTVVLGLSESTLLKPVEALLSQNFRQAGMATLVLWLSTMGIVALLLRLGAQQKLAFERSEQLIANEARLRAIYDVLPVGISLTDCAGHIIDCNPASEKLLGITRAEHLANDLKQLTILRADGGIMPPEEYVSARAMKEGLAIRDTEIQLVTPQGNLWLQVSAMPINARGFGAVIAYADITQRKQAEAELLRSNSELEQFSYSISHDMRQPLRMISSYLQLLERGLADQLDSEKREYFNFAIDGAKRMDTMILGLLEYSRVGRKDEPAPTATRRVLDEALRFLQPATAEARAEVRIEGDWPSILANPDEILRLLQNLIGNALKFRIAGRTPEISIASQTAGNTWCVGIADNGVGIQPEQIGRLFQVFQRLQSRAAYEGTGIGLALCRKIVEHHGGRIWVESAGEGSGTRFIFELPLNSAPSPAGDIDLVEPRASGEPA
ncbi:MAG: ATP-binding protein [Rhodocyclaceae bacterium]